MQRKVKINFDSDLEKVSRKIELMKNSIIPSSAPELRNAPAVRVIDCILSLNRNYNNFVCKRLNSFKSNYPHVYTIRDLQNFMASFPTAGNFLLKCLDYNYPDRAETLKKVVDWLVTIRGDGDTGSQLLATKQWLKSADSDYYRTLKIRGFGLAGFQYLRMLFGANTAKPDIHLCRTVATWIEQNSISPMYALTLLEKASAQNDVCLRDLDMTIWENATQKQVQCKHQMRLT